MHPAALLLGRGPDLSDGLPETKRAIAGREFGIDGSGIGELIRASVSELN